MVSKHEAQSAFQGDDDVAGAAVTIEVTDKNEIALYVSGGEAEQALWLYFDPVRAAFLAADIRRAAEESLEA